MMRYMCWAGTSGGLTDGECYDYYDDVILQLPGQGTNGSTTIDDVSDFNNTCTVSGNAAISTAKSKFGDSSIYLDGSSSTYIEVSPSAVMDLPNDFTIRGWFYVVDDTSGADQCFITFSAIGTARDWTWQRKTSTGYTNGYNTTEGDYIVSVDDLTVDTWHFLEFSRRQKEYFIFVDGAPFASHTATDVVPIQADGLRIGAWTDGSERLKAYIEDLQIVRGLCLYGEVPVGRMPTTVCPVLDLEWSSTRRHWAWSLDVDLQAESVATLDYEVTAQVIGNVAKSSGKWYFEVEVQGTPNTSLPHSPSIGVCGENDGNPNMIDLVGSGASQWGYLRSALKRHNGSATSFGSTFTAGDTIGVAIDFTAGYIWFSKNGTWQGSGDPVNGTNPAYTSVSGTLVPHASANAGAPTVTLNKSSSNTPSGFTYWAP